MNFLNLGIGEILLILILALIIFGPGNMVKTAREIGAFIRKVSKSPYWQEVWATRNELSELPKMIAKEAQLDETIRDLNQHTKGIQSTLAASMTELIKEVEEPIKEADKELQEELKEEEIKEESDSPPAETSPASEEIK
jgi:Sec-independent protein translocase protein TatA